MEIFWIIIAIYFLMITLVGFWLIFRFNRSEFSGALASFFLTIFIIVSSFIIYSSLRNTAFGKMVQSGWRGERNLMTISILLATFLIVLPSWLLVYALVSFFKWKKRRRKRKIN